MNHKANLLCSWAGPVFAVTFCIGLWFVGQFVPPHNPLATAEDIARFYQAHPVRIMIGLLITMFSATFWIPWSAALAAQMRRMEGRMSVLAETQMGCGVAVPVFIILPVMVWATAAFRPERNPELLLFFNDFAFLQFVGVVAPAYFQITSVGVATLFDKAAQPVFPRWVGYYSIWFALSTLTGGACFFFKVGPFAWNGVIAFWMPLILYGFWLAIMFWQIRKSLLRQALSEH